MKSQHEVSRRVFLNRAMKACWGAGLAAPSKALAGAQISSPVGPPALPRAKTPQANLISVESPDGHLRAEFSLQNVGGIAARPSYQITYQGRPVVLDSSLGLEVKEGANFSGEFRVRKVERSQHRSTWRPVYGERRVIPDHYREVLIELEQPAGAKSHLQITLRAYDHGVALRYAIPAQNGLNELTINSEKTEFRFPENTWAYQEHGTEGEYSRVLVEDIQPECMWPLTLEYASSLVASLTIGALENYPRMLLSPASPGSRTLVPASPGPARVSLPFATPWWFFLVGDEPVDLVEHNYLVLNLNRPCALPDTSWIKPGKVIRAMSISTTGGKACVDFAVDRGLQYVEFDGGWYGDPYSEASDATRAAPFHRPNPNNPQPQYEGLDLQEVIAYASSRNIGILLYVDRRAAERQMDEIFPLYQKWGVKGVKFGFVQVGPQQWTVWLLDAVKKAAAHHLMLDIHDGFRPSGFSRTYPNLLTQEGVRGNESMPPAGHNATLPFTRFLAGAADYTVCYYDPKIKNTHAHQLALSIIFYSPLQFIFWYDKPSAYHGEPEVELFKYVPTVWDDTLALHGKIGQYVTLARRSGDEWFVGSISKNGRELPIQLFFLDKGRKYVAHIYADEPQDSPSRTHVGIDRRLVDASVSVVATLISNGGLAMRIVPASQEDLGSYKPYRPS